MLITLTPITDMTIPPQIRKEAIENLENYFLGIFVLGLDFGIGLAILLS